MNDAVAWHIDKSALTLSEPRRYRDRAHLEFVSSQPCLLCGRRPSDAHHLRFANRAHWAAGSATSSWFLFAALTIVSSIAGATKRHGGKP